jgi:hypothetical protein
MFVHFAALLLSRDRMHTNTQWYYAATTLPAEATGAGQDLMLVAGPERCSSYLMEADTRVVSV